MSDRPDISIIGAGKVGTAIGVLAARAGWRVSAMAGRTEERTEKAAASVGADVLICAPVEAACAAQLVLLTVPDDEIEKLCASLAGDGAFRDGAVVAHCSGALTSDVLTSARDQCGCHTGSMHPLQTFPTVEAAVTRLPGAFYFIEGDRAALATLEQLAGDLGGKPVRISPDAKALYHAAAVVACNYLATLLDAALALGEKAGIERETFLPAIEPLVRATVDNVFATSPQDALTGPIARGDVGVIRRHLEAIGADRQDKCAALYRLVGVLTVDLAVKKGTIDPLTALGLCEELLANEPDDSEPREKPRKNKPARKPKTKKGR